MVDWLILIDTTPRYTDDLRTMWAVRAKAARENGVSEDDLHGVDNPQFWICLAIQNDEWRLRMGKLGST
jgi:hypothetical protein